MKKILFIIMSVALIIGLMACNKNAIDLENKPSDDEKSNSEEVPTKVAYANWAENEGGLRQDENCLNADKYIFSDFPRLPVFKFDTKAQLDEFKNKYKDIFTMDNGYNDVASFNDITANYNDEFFESNSLILAYKEASSGSYRYAINKVIKENESLILKVKQTNNPEVHTDDMSGWFLIAEVSKDFIKDCKEIDAHLDIH